MTLLTEIKPKSAKMKKGRKDVDNARRPGQKLLQDRCSFDFQGIKR